MADVFIKELQQGIKGAFESIGGGAGPRNPKFAVTNPKIGFDQDQVRACYRYIKTQFLKRGKRDEANLSFIRLWFGPTNPDRASTGQLGSDKRSGHSALALAADAVLSGVRNDWAEKAEDEGDYHKALATGPNSQAVQDWDQELITKSPMFQRQIAYEAELWGLNVFVLKSCFLGYAVVIANNWSPYYINMVSLFCGHSGAPIYPPANTQAEFANATQRIAGKKNGGRRFRKRKRFY